MEISEYQEKVLSTAVYPGQHSVKGLEYTLFGALGELGEIANKYKKILRKGDDVYKHAGDLMEETGDALWYLVAFLDELGYDTDYAAQHNVNKLQGRKAQGTLKDRKPEEVKETHNETNV